MKKYDWVSNIKINIFMLRIIGLWPSGDHAYTFGPYVIYVSTLLTVFLIGHSMSQLANIYFIRNNLTAVTGTVYILLVEIMAILKVYYLIRNMKMLKELLKILNSEMFQPRNSLQLRLIEEDIWLWKLIYKFMMYMAAGANVFCAISPLLTNIKLPFMAWYPFDYEKSPFYEIVYVYQITSVALVATAQVNIDGLVTALNVFNGSQFDILSDNLRNLQKLGEDVVTNFINCVEHHKEILEFADKSNNFLNWILFIQFFVSAFTIAITMFRLSLVAPLSTEFYTLTTYGTSITAEIFMYCWFGNKLEEKSNNILYAAFECDWTNFSKNMQKKLLFFILRAQTPVRLSALNLFYLSLDTFMRIMKTAWSYFALLHQLSSKN